MVKGGHDVPEQGDLVWIEFNPKLGHEQAGRRPSVVLSPAAYNAKVGLGIFCPITSTAKGYPFEVELPPGCPIRGVILADHVRSLDWRARKAEWICSLPKAVVSEVVQKLGTLLP